MNVKINRRTFEDALLSVVPFVPQKSPIEILKYAKISVKGNRMKIEAHNAQCSIKKYMEGIESDQDGAFLIELADLNKLISKIPGDEININITDNTIYIDYSVGKACFQIVSANEYPVFNKIDKCKSIGIPLRSSALLECINIAKNFVGKDSFSPQLQTIYAYIRDGFFGYCATNTSILVHNSVPNEIAGATDINWYIEPTVFASLSRSCAESDVVKIHISPQIVSYNFGNTIIETTCTQGKYPDYNRVIPRTWNVECLINRNDIIDSLSRMAISADSTSLVKITISESDMIISSQNLNNLRSVTDKISHEGCNQSIKIGFNLNYIMNCLKSCVDSQICLRMTDQSHPMLIHQASNPNMTILIMPMVIN